MPRAGARHAVAMWIAVALLAATACVRAFGFPLNHDAGWWLQIAESMLAGDDLYHDIVEINPPLMGYLAMIPVILSDLGGLEVGPTFTSLVLLLIALIAVYAVTQLGGLSETRLARPVLAGALIVSLILLVGNDLGQREHLMFVLLVPYTMVLWRKTSGLPVGDITSTAVGVAAAVGIALKPHFVLVPVALELTAWRATPGSGLLTGLRQKERLTLLTLLVAYAAWVVVEGSYLPLLQRSAGLYAAFSTTEWTALVISWPVIGLAAALVAQRFFRSAVADLARFFIALGVAGAILTLLQLKGWSYHFYPAMAGLTIAAVLLAYDFAVRSWRDLAAVRMVEIVGLVAVLGVTAIAAAGLVRNHDRVGEAISERLSSQLRSIEAVDFEGPILVLSAFVNHSFPLATYSNSGWASPFPALWWIRSRPRETLFDLEVMHPVEKEFTERLAARFSASKPGIVLVDVSEQAIFGSRFPYVEYMSRSAVFEAAWQSFSIHGTVGAFEIWVREPPAAAKEWSADS